MLKYSVDALLRESFAAKHDFYLQHISLRRYLHEGNKYLHSFVFVRPPEDFDFAKAAMLDVDPEDPDFEQICASRKRNLRRACRFSTRNLLFALSEVFADPAADFDGDDPCLKERSTEDICEELNCQFVFPRRGELPVDREANIVEVPDLMVLQMSPTCLQSVSCAPGDPFEPRDSFLTDAVSFLTDKIEFIEVRRAISSATPEFFDGFLASTADVLGRLEGKVIDSFHGVMNWFSRRSAVAATLENFEPYSPTIVDESEDVQKHLAVREAQIEVDEQTAMLQCASKTPFHEYALIQGEKYEMLLQMLGSPEPGEGQTKGTTFMYIEVAKRESHWPVDENGMLVRTTERSLEGSELSAPISLSPRDRGHIRTLTAEECPGLSMLGLVRLVAYLIKRMKKYHFAQFSCQSLQQWLFTQRVAVGAQGDVSGTPNHRWCGCDGSKASHSDSVLGVCSRCGDHRVSLCRNDDFLCMECICAGVKPLSSALLESVEYEIAPVFWEAEQESDEDLVGFHDEVSGMFLSPVTTRVDVGHHFEEEGEDG